MWRWREEGKGHFKGSLPSFVHLHLYLNKIGVTRNHSHEEFVRLLHRASEAKPAIEAGVELLVLDDGWFGKRDDVIGPD